jgi:hypothetical protein
MGNPFYYWTAILKIDFKFSKHTVMRKQYFIVSLVQAIDAQTRALN